VIVNREGWILTAGHVLEAIDRGVKEEQQAIVLDQQTAAIAADATLSASQKRKKIASLGKLKPDHSIHYSTWFGKDRLLLFDTQYVEHVDLGVGRLDPFDPTWVSTYPVFKDPTKNFDTGRSLCKLGFPFHSITPVWHPDLGSFELPAGALPLPYFPIEGIFTRTAELIFQGASLPPFPSRWVETSSPGLRGQSGGPIFDAQGRVWAIQVNTMHLPLGFSPTVPGQPTNKEHQFLNVGRGVHPDTIFGFLNHLGVKYDVSSD
jgi:hypothetical protein